MARYQQQSFTHRHNRNFRTYDRERFERKFPWERPYEITVFSVIPNLATKKILFVHNIGAPTDDKPSGWGLPGGGRKPGEDALRANSREVRDESGYTVEGPATLLFQRPDSASYANHEVDVFLSFVDEIHPGEIREKGEIDRAEWFTVEEFMSMPTAPFDRLEQQPGVDYKYLFHQIYLLDALGRLGWLEEFVPTLGWLDNAEQIPPEALQALTEPANL